MKRRKLKDSNSSISGRNKVVKNEYYYEYKKKQKIKICLISASVLLVSSVVWYIKDVPVRAEMTITNSTIEWIPEKKNLKGITFQIMKDGKVIEETNKLKYIDSSQKDTGVPQDIEEINTYRNLKSLKIIWKEPIDTGSDNRYQIFALNKFGKKVFKSEEVTGGLVSGIDKYIVRFNGKEIETTKPEFIVNCENLKNGKYAIDIKSVDKAGNTSDFKTFAFDIETLNFEFKDGKLIPKDYIYTNDDYNFYIIDKEIADSEKEVPQFDKQMFLVNKDLSTILDSGFKPTMSMPSYILKSNELNVSWSQPNENSKSYSFYVESVNKSTLEKNYSNLQEITCSSTINGYHYALNNASSYVIKSTDKYTSERTLSFDINSLDKNKKYYFHIATIDSTGALSDTKSIPLDLKTSNSMESKKDSIKKFIYKTKITSFDEYQEVVDILANNFTSEEVNSLTKNGITISLIKEDFDKYLKEHNIANEEKSDSCVKKNKSVYFNVNKSIDSLIKVLKSLIK